MKTPHTIEIHYQDPAVLFAPHAQQPFAQFLDSAVYDEEQGRYSYIALDPLLTITDSKDLFGKIKRTLSEYDFIKHENLPPFQGGFLGYWGYELLHELEDINKKAADHFKTPVVALGFYDCIAAFDHHLNKAWIISIAGEDKALRLKEALENTQTQRTFTPVELEWQSDFSKDEFIEGVQQVIDYIHAGDIFQANLTQRFSASLSSGFNKFDFYQNLRKINPAFYAAYLNFEDFTIASSSPERFLKCEGQRVDTRPIKGTRRRQENDEAVKQDLLNSEKDRAENTMIVDLLRNDISRVCKPNSVHVTELCGLHSFATVHHLISTVQGELQDNKDSVDLLEACFPGGSITGAPKVRAMEIISELERCQRGPYCGSIGFIGFDGTLDTNIVIRTLVFKEDKVCVQVGGGIVADSDATAEYQETLDKAHALFKAFREVAS